MVPLPLSIALPRRKAGDQALGVEHALEAGSHFSSRLFPEAPDLESECARLAQGAAKRPAPPAARENAEGDPLVLSGPTCRVPLQGNEVAGEPVATTVYLLARTDGAFEAGDLIDFTLSLSDGNGATRFGLRLENGTYAPLTLLAGVGLIVSFTLVAAAL
jgi:hypothetical protein